MNATQQQIYEKLKASFSPRLLDVINESHQHGTQREDSHFKLVMVSDEFENMKLIARHRSVNGCLSEELAGPVHALSMNLYTPDEWSKSQGLVPKSPACLGGSKKDRP